MSFYSSNIKSWVISPVFDRSLVRSEFRLPQNAYLAPNIRLLNVGVMADGSARYNLLSGSSAHIKNIYLMDGKVVLDQVNNFQAIESFKRYNKTNNANCDIEKILHNHGMGFIYGRNYNNSTPNAQVMEFHSDAPNSPQLSESITPKGFINLQEVFPLLRALEIVDTNVFTKLSVVLEYTTANVLTLGEPARVNGTVQPLIVVDEILSMPQGTSPKFAGVKWNCMELETVQLPQGEAGKQQVFDWKLMGFNNKSLNRLLVQKVGEVSDLYLSLGSEAMVGETIQFVVNGSNLLADQGIDGPNMALGLLSDTFGVCNSIPCSNDTACYKIDNMVANAFDRVGHLSYFGVSVSASIQNLQVNYSRNCRTGGSGIYSQPLQFNFWGEVSKAIVPTKTGYSVVYV